MSMAVSPRKAVELMLLFLTVGFSLLGFASVSSSLSADDGRWSAPLLWFSLLSVSFLSAGILYRERLMHLAFGALVVGPSLLFTLTLPHLVLAFLSVLFILAGFRKIDDDLRSRLALSFRKSMGAGIFFLVFPIALLVASQYYAEIRSYSWQDIVPRFSLAEGGGDIALRAAGSIVPELGKIREGRVTVDEFILSARKTTTPPIDIGDQISTGMISTLSLEAGRAELGRLVGRELVGAEQMTDVLSEALRNKTIAFLSGAKAERNLPNGALPFFLALLLFITILSLSSLLRGIWVIVASWFIRILIRFGALSIEKIPTEQEVLR